MVSWEKDRREIGVMSWRGDRSDVGVIWRVGWSDVRVMSWREG